MGWPLPSQLLTKRPAAMTNRARRGLGPVRNAGGTVRQKHVSLSSAAVPGSAPCRLQEATPRTTMTPLSAWIAGTLGLIGAYMCAALVQTRATEMSRRPSKRAWRCRRSRSRESCDATATFKTAEAAEARSRLAIRACLFEASEGFGQQSVPTVRSVQFVTAFHRLVKIRFSQALRRPQTASWRR
jgi:hypothetical protein